MKIGDASAQLGIPASTIRFYEQQGLIPKLRREAGQRHFDDDAMFGLQFIRLAQSAGFTIAEIKMLQGSYKQDSSAHAPWKQMAQAKQSEVRDKMRALQQVDAILTELLSCKCSSLNQCIEVGMARPAGGAANDG